MKAIVQTRYGSPDDLVLREVDPPEVGDDEVRVRVRAASLHPDVWHVVTGQPWVLRLMGGGIFRPRNPIPGTDVAGVVESVGSEVTRFRPGDLVFGETSRSNEWTNGGAFAECVSVPEALLAPKPDGVSFEEAASVPTSGYIALLNLRGGTVVRPGDRVLVNGAGGGVGAIALQIAKARGARVTAVDTTGKLDMLRSLGADEVVDYTEEDFTRRGVRHDLIFDVPGNHSLRACRRALTAEGKYVLIGHEGFGASGKRIFGLFPRFIGLIVRSFFTGQLRMGRSSIPSRAESIANLREHLEAGTITPVVDSAYPLAELREAFRHMIEDELRGKVILTVG
ncbi:MAG: zinc-binding dehydrogenase [Gemmatimonadetes bacterium]|nr:NAD(P)-dependent alcohol dehydrogenase [Gemmatimonadota bacterium]NIR79131.1 NAD(P)-dependent alcohol dehydrogenase [Gemmatimonadota bacterium]NIT87784.1 NAD(P)-dependent alcohol dehydrogenase [Gemmatimonadota bacterium]NIU31647.1 NAD(P)-dependent alcohol dehydrogenase [Gemmatimonadota bacterium]NIU36271.1 zinc-binding dehydrogenase [Gemmatimonadota bacterium]